MKPESGRGKLYSALKTARRRWQSTTDVWNDSAREEFERQVWVPLEAISTEALHAMDQLGQLFAQIRRDCQGDPEPLS